MTAEEDLLGHEMAQHKELFSCSLLQENTALAMPPVCLGSA